MKIALASDLHLEFGPLEVKNTENADLLILAGDILVVEDLYQYMRMTELIHDHKSMTAVKFERYKNFFASACSEFKNVIWIAGNHEHYHGNMIHTPGIVNAFLRHEGFDNVKYMDYTAMELDGFTFYGGTLWTDLNKGDPSVMNRVQDGMNDYRCIRNGTMPLLPRHTIEFHEKMLEGIKTALATCEKMVVVGHHAPSAQSIHWRYQNVQNSQMNYGYNSDLSEFILDNPKIKLWVHGHVHDNFDYMIGSTRIVCNPRGYIGYEARAKDYKLQYIDL